MRDMVEKNGALPQLEAELRADRQQANPPVIQQAPDGDIKLDGEAPPRSLLVAPTRTARRLRRHCTAICACRR